LKEIFARLSNRLASENAPLPDRPDVAAEHAREEKPVTADTALPLGKFFKTGAAFWMNIQARFDLETAEDVLAPQIKKIASYEAP